MSDLLSLWEKYENIDTREISSNDLDEIEYCLLNSKIESINHAKIFLELLSKFRLTIYQIGQKNGVNFNQQLQSLLSVGADGVYDDPLRFIYELIQNADDCEYDNISGHHLRISFDNENSTIELLYNEKGFTSSNVFSITGIAGSTKNNTMEHEKNLIQIGEKGLGFKSVFGAAESVLIQSNYFSFRISTEQFTIPIPEFNKFDDRIDGTRILINLKKKNSAVEIYRELKKKYASEKNILNSNPVLFLNQLSKITYYQDSENYFSFEVSRSNLDFSDERLQFEQNISIKYLEASGEKNKETSIDCFRYSKQINYNKIECQSRYGETTSLIEKKHQLIAVLPKPQFLDKLNFTGVLYSFFPTQIQTTVPIILHAPFKLIGSRESIDPQDSNEWFLKTNDELYSFFSEIYEHLVTSVNTDIILYLPAPGEGKYGKNIFKRNEDDAGGNLLYQDIRFLFGKKDEKVGGLTKLNIIPTTNGTFESIKDVCILNIDAEMDYEQYKGIFALISMNEKNIKLFDLLFEHKLLSYPFQVKENIADDLFMLALNSKNESEIVQAFEYLDLFKNYDYSKNLKNKTSYELNEYHISSIVKYPEIYKQFCEYSHNYIPPNTLVFENKNNLVKIQDVDEFELLSKVFKDLKEILSKEFYEYIGKSSFYFIQSDSFILTSNAIICDKTKILSSLGDLHDLLSASKDSFFSIHLKMEQEEMKFDNRGHVGDYASTHDEAMEYLKSLRSYQLVQKSILGVFYSSMLKLINESASDNLRFINELLQNADDCTYPGSEINFSLSVKNETLTVEYNEDGFDKRDIFSLTSISKSTKKQLWSKQKNPTGDKGIGFKSVFIAAKSVEIRSGYFHFSLESEQPTIPLPIDKNEFVQGTVMTFSLNDKFDTNIISEDMVLRLCLCLKKINSLDINGIILKIRDFDDYREINLNEKSFKFIKYACSSEVTFYVPDDPANFTEGWLYNTLPTKIEIKAPLVINALFELTTARTDVLQNDNNSSIMQSIEEFYFNFLNLHKEKMDRPIDILSFLPVEADAIKLFSEESLKFSNDFKTKISKLEILPTLDKSGKVKWVSASNGWKENVYVMFCVERFAFSTFKHSVDSVVLHCDDSEWKKYETTIKYLGVKYRDSCDTYQRLVAHNVYGKIEEILNEQKFSS